MKSSNFFSIKKRIKMVLLVALMALLIVSMFVSCGKSTSDHEGKYTKDDFYISLNNDGSFVAENYIKLEGTYKVEGTTVIFNVKKMNDKEFKNTAKGKLEGDTLTGPDNMVYKKSK